MVSAATVLKPAWTVVLAAPCSMPVTLAMAWNDVLLQIDADSTIHTNHEHCISHQLSV